MTYRLRNILIAVVLALLAALLTSFYVTNYERNLKDDQKPESVFVATKDVPPGTAAEDVLGSFEQRKIPHGDVVPGALVSKDDVAGQVSTQWIFAEEQVSLRRFSDVAASGPRADLKGNLRAFQIQGDQNQVLAGTLKKGDRVDVVAAFVYKIGEDGNNSYTASRVVIRDLLVIRPPGTPAVGSKLASGLSDRFPVMLQVTDAQAPKLEFVITTAKSGSASGVVGWNLQLRPPVKAEDSPESIQTLDTMLRDGLTRRQAQVLFGKIGGQ
jgi:Flp pilus assembly protein CpaB